MDDPQQAWKTVHAFHNLIRLKSEYLSENCARVAKTSIALLTAAESPQVSKDGLQAGALLKDIGKIGIPDQILNPKERLGQVEQDLLRTYPLLGYEALKAVPFPWPEVLSVIRHHQEKFDGSGYPDGLAGAEIPQAAQVVAIANFFVSLTLPRHGGPAFSPHQAFTLLDKGAGSSFNPELVRAFESVFEPIIAEQDSHQG